MGQSTWFLPQTKGEKKLEIHVNWKKKYIYETNRENLRITGYLTIIRNS